MCCSPAKSGAGLHLYCVSGSADYHALPEPENGFIAKIKTKLPVVSLTDSNSGVILPAYIIGMPKLLLSESAKEIYTIHEQIWFDPVQYKGISHWLVKLVNRLSWWSMPLFIEMGLSLISLCID